MEKQTEFVTSNSNYIKTCILYEMIQKKPIFESYRNFCKTIGNDVMDYLDFEYWYYRFYHGNMDFDHDPSTEPKQKRIADLPPEILSMIFRKLDPVERAYMRNMNRLVKRTADIHSAIFEEIRFLSDRQRCSFSLNKKPYKYLKNGGDSSTCIVQKNERPGKIVHANYRNLCIQNLCQALALPNTQIQNFSVFVTDFPSEQMESFPEQMRVTSLILESRARAPVMKLLSKMMPGELKTLTLVALRDQTGNVDPIYETEQFKKAEHVDLLLFTTMRTFNEFVHFEHLKTFKVSLLAMNATSIVGLRDMLSSATIFEECTIEVNIGYPRPEEPVAPLGRALGVDIPDGRILSFTHRHSIPYSDAFLEFNIDEKNNIQRIHIKKVHSPVV